MKTHDIADALAALSRIMKASPNVELTTWAASLPIGSNGVDSSAVALSVSTLAAISRVSKAEWRKLLAQWKLPVEIRNSDSVRDLVGRIFRYLEENPEALRKLHREATKKNKKVSAELMEALSVLLGEDSEETDK